MVTDFVSRFEIHITNLSEAVEKDDEIELAPPSPKETPVSKNDPAQKIEMLKLRLEEIKQRRMAEEVAE